MLKKLFIIFFVSSAVWGNAAGGIKLPVLGSLFPLRIAVLMFAGILLYKTYAARENIIILQNSTLSTKQLRNVTAFTFVGMMLAGFVTLYWAYNTSKAIVGLVTWMTSFACIFIALTFLKTEEDVIFAARVFIISVT